jgi:MFS family permease
VRLLRGPLASRNYRLLVACDVTSMLGMSMATVAIPFAVLSIGGSAADVGYVLATGLVPTAVFLLLGGVLADRFPRHQVMMIANVAQALAQAGFAVLVLTGHARLWEMMALNAARSCAFGFYMPAAQGLLPQTVTADQLASANAGRRLGLNGAQIAGAALGGIVVGLAGPGWGLVADAASYVLAGAMRAGMRFSRLPPMASTSILQELREGWRAFTSRRWLWTVVVQFSLVNAIFAGAVGVLGPVVADHHLGGARSWGLILAAEAAGAVLGATVMVRYRPARLLLAASLAVPFLALPLLALAIPLSVPVIAAAALLAGVGSEVFEVNWVTAMQQQIPAALLSRVSAYDILGSLALSPVGTILAGPLAIVIGITAVLAGGGGIIVAASLAILFVPEVRGLRRHTAEASTTPASTAPETAPPAAS